MEKVISVEDKIRRAEEIYYKRKNLEMPNIQNGKQKTNIKLLNKMIKQIILCLIIYIIFYSIINNNYIFSNDFTKKVREILSQDINLNKISFELSNFFNKSTKENLEQENVIEDIQSNNENIGGAIEVEKLNEVIENINTITNEQTIETKEPVLSQMEQDVNYIKTTISFIKPVEGTISSLFGLRNPTTASVPKNHTGLDIAASMGTKIISATDGTVIYTSSKGDYGKHIKIQTSDIVVLYAHCNKLYVKEGDIIKQGQEIAEVGSTGNTTGPHLHFEIRYQERYVNPQMVLNL